MAGYGAAVPSSRANPFGMVSQPPSKVSGLLYGLGLGGFIDGIVLHQILQWHHMVSDVSRYPVNTIAGLEVNTLADGFFHLATWVLVLAASIAAITAWRQGRLAPNWSFHFGLVLTGWGIFNVVEGLGDRLAAGDGEHLCGATSVRIRAGSPESTVRTDPVNQPPPSATDSSGPSCRPPWRTGGRQRTLAPSAVRAVKSRSSAR